MKKLLATTKQNYQLIISALTIATILSCFVYGQVNKAQAQKVAQAVEKTR